MSESNSSSEESGIQREELNKKLLQAAESGDHESVSRALGDGAEITCKDHNGATGLHLGAYKGHDNIVKTFIEAGIDINLRDEGDSKWTALMNAANYDNISCLQILLDKGADADIRDEEDSQTALMLAASKNNSDIVAELLSRGANPDIKDEKKGQTALMIAALRNKPNIVAELLMKGADDNILNNREKNAIHN